MKKRFIGLLITLIILGFTSLVESCLAQPANTVENGETAYEMQLQHGGPIVQPSAGLDKAMDKGSGGIGFHYWQGFAIKGDESYILRVSIEGVRPVGPMNVRRLLASNMSLEEVREEMLAEEGNVTYMGHLKLGDSSYRLSNVEVKFEDDNLTLSSDLNGPLASPSDDSSIQSAGHLAVNTTSYEMGLKGQGILVITSGQLIGSYKVLLDMLH